MVGVPPDTARAGPAPSFIGTPPSDSPRTPRRAYRETQAVLTQWHEDAEAVTARAAKQLREEEFAQRRAQEAEQALHERYAMAVQEAEANLDARAREAVQHAMAENRALLASRSIA